MGKHFCNVVKFLVRGRITDEERQWLLSSKEIENGQILEVVEYAIGYEHLSEEHHEHTHVVLRVSKQIEDDIDYLRSVWDLGNWSNIQDIRLSQPPDESFELAARYACKSGDYEWPSQVILFPYDIKRPKWNKMQRDILRELKEQNHRQILCVVEKRGNTGKSFLANWYERRLRASLITVNRSYRDVLREAYCFHEKSFMNMDMVFVDIPKAFPQDDLRYLFSAVETLKDGRIMDDRYSNRLSYIPSPKLCIFINEDAPVDYLTADRWRIMVVSDVNHNDMMDYWSYRRYLDAEKSRRDNARRQKVYRERQKNLIS